MTYRVSVAMATYNGEKYIQQQIDSILMSLSSKDELVISDDGSTDNTISIIDNYVNSDTRIKLIKGPRKGLVKNFENALMHTGGKYIFLADQDDIWAKNKVEEVLECFNNTDATLVIHDCKIINSDDSIIEPSFFALRNSGPGFIHNIIKNSFIGCCMAFKRELLNYALPFPNDIPYHDQWLGLVNNMVGKNVFLNKKLFSYRRHEDNVSPEHHSSITNMVKMRFIFVKELTKRYLAIKRSDNL